MLQLPDQHNQNVPFKPGDNRNVPAELICWWKLPENWDLKREEGGDSTLTAVGEEPAGGLHASDWLVFKSDWQNCPVGGWVRPQGRGISVVLLAFRQQVTDLLLQLRANGVLSQNQNAQTGGVVLNHVQEHLHRTSQNICHPVLMTPQQQLKNGSRTSVKGARSPAGPCNNRSTCAEWLVRPVPSRSRTSSVLLDATATASIPAIWSPAEGARRFKPEKWPEQCKWTVATEGRYPVGYSPDWAPGAESCERQRWPVEPSLWNWFLGWHSEWAPSDLRHRRCNTWQQSLLISDGMSDVMKLGRWSGSTWLCDSGLRPQVLCAAGSDLSHKEKLKQDLVIYLYCYKSTHGNCEIHTWQLV